MADLIYEYFCRPIMDPSVQGYNLVNTTVYAAILFAAILFFVYPFLKKNKIKPDFRFMISLLPFVIFGSAFRVLNDMAIHEIFSKTCSPLEIGFYTFTPGLWLLTTAIVIAAIFAAKKIAKKDDKKFSLIFGSIGTAIALPFVLYEISIFKAGDGVLMVLGLLIAITAIVKVAVEIRHKEFFKDNLNILVIAGQVLDGSATFIATDIFNCGEQHPLSESILSVHPALFIVVKIAIALLIIHALEKDVEDENFRNFIKIAVIILGFATGTRDLLTLGVGTCL